MVKYNVTYKPYRGGRGAVEDLVVNNNKTLIKEA